MNEIRQTILTDSSSSIERSDQSSFISDADLLRTYVTPQMMAYFQAKMSDVRSDTIIIRVCELLKYLILIEFSPGRILFSREVDDIWHYWILQTHQYRQLCDKLPGKCFRHHSSVDYQKSMDIVAIKDRSEAARRILSFFVSYHRNFGPLAPDRVTCWPTAQRIMEVTFWGLSDLNNFLAERALVRTSRCRSIKLRPLESPKTCGAGLSSVDDAKSQILP
jgi:hypothetical protein